MSLILCSVLIVK